jgi:hypothetical protein
VSASAASTESLSVLGHDIESLLGDGEEWQLICSCGWETWRRAHEWQARDDFDDHVADDLSTRLRRLHDARKAGTL